MPLDDTTLKILFLFIPGIISKKIIEKLTNYKEVNSFKFLINSFLLGFLNYFIYTVLIYTINHIKTNDLSIYFFNTLSSKDKPLIFYEIFYVSIISIISSILISYLLNKQYFYTLMNNIGVTSLSGERDVWNIVFGSEEVSNWIDLRDFDNKLTISGWVRSYSSDFHDGELFIKDVSVYSLEEGKLLYELNGLYLNLKGKNISIEFPKN